MRTCSGRRSHFLAGLALMAVAAFWAGCEHNSDVADNGADDGVPRFVVTPGAVTLDTNETSVALRVEGGVPPFQWAVSDAAMGAVTPTLPTDARTATYTRPAPTTDGIVTVIVRDSRSWQAQSVIIQR